MNNRDQGKSNGSVKKMADGGSVGLLERIKAGNIDERGSEAYNRWGKGAAEGDAAELTRESRRASPGLAAATSTADDAPDAQSRRVAIPSAPIGGYDSTDVDPGLPKTPDTPDEPAKPKAVKVAKAPVVSTPKAGGGLAAGAAVGVGIIANARASRDAKDANKAVKAPAPDASAPIIREGPDKNTSLAEDWGNAIKGGLKRAARAIATPNMANGGLVGAGRHYGKK